MQTKTTLVCYVELPMTKSKQNVSHLREIPVATNAYLTLRKLHDVIEESDLEMTTKGSDWLTMKNMNSRIRFSLAVESVRHLNDLGKITSLYFQNATDFI